MIPGLDPIRLDQLTLGIEAIDHGNLAAAIQCLSEFCERDPGNFDLCLIEVLTLKLILEESVRLKRSYGAARPSIVEILLMHIEVSICQFKSAEHRGNRLLLRSDLSPGNYEKLICGYGYLFEMKNEHAVASVFARIFMNQVMRRPSDLPEHYFPAYMPPTASLHALNRDEFDEVWIATARDYVEHHAEGSHMTLELKKKLLSLEEQTAGPSRLTQ